ARNATRRVAREWQAQLPEPESREDEVHLERDRSELLRRPHVCVVFGLQLLEPTLEHAVIGSEQHGLRVRTRPELVHRLEVSLPRVPTGPAPPLEQRSRGTPCGEGGMRS